MPLFVSKHAIERYQARIEGVDDSTATLAIRKWVLPLVGTLPEGYHRYEHRAGGPSFDAIIYPATTAQIVASTVRGDWIPR